MRKQRCEMKPGDVCIIRNHTLSGEGVVEGKATLREYCGYIGGSEDEIWMVEFEGGNGDTYRRIVLATDNAIMSKRKKQQRKGHAGEGVAARLFKHKLLELHTTHVMGLFRKGNT